MDIEIVVLGTRTFKKKDTGTVYYVIDYYRTSNFSPKTDFINVVEYQNINKKLDGKHAVLCKGLRKANDFDNLYVFDIELLK